jgi:hypothetical protein
MTKTMKTQILHSTMMAAAVAMVAACSGQPQIPCAVGHGGYSAKFSMVTCTGADCTGPNATCVREGDIIGLQKYNETSGNAEVYIKSEWLAENEYGLVGDDPRIPVAHGKLTAFRPAADNFCSVPNITEMTADDVNGNNLTYAFSNMKLYNTGQVPGTQWTADLTIHNPSSSCLATYKVAAVYPVVGCLNADTGVEDPTVCNKPDQWYSGLQANPLFALTCGKIRNDGDPDIFGAEVGSENLACVAAKAIPSLNTTP